MKAVDMGQTIRSGSRFWMTENLSLFPFSCFNRHLGVFRHLDSDDTYIVCLRTRVRTKKKVQSNLPSTRTLTILSIYTFPYFLDCFSLDFLCGYRRDMSPSFIPLPASNVNRQKRLDMATRSNYIGHQRLQMLMKQSIHYARILFCGCPDIALLEQNRATMMMMIMMMMIEDGNHDGDEKIFKGYNGSLYS